MESISASYKANINCCCWLLAGALYVLLLELDRFWSPR